MKYIVPACLLAATLSGCVAHPRVSPVPKFTARAVYSANMITPGGSKRDKGQAITNAPVHVYYRVQQKSVQMVVGSRSETKASKHYYTFTDSTGGFSIPRLNRLHLATRSPGSRTTIEKPNLQVLCDTANIRFVNTNRKNPYLFSHGDGDAALAQFLSKDLQPLHRSDRNQLKQLKEDWPTKACTATNQSAPLRVTD